uniref:RT_RNaseH_2 domain-containing protein n=1 Tax=Caenorhabditis japonica TaxID=281687 RepID=A0A8R1IS57_CAEJA
MLQFCPGVPRQNTSRGALYLWNGLYLDVKNNAPHGPQTQYDITIVHIDGKKNTVADCISRAKDEIAPLPTEELEDIIEFPVCMAIDRLKDRVPKQFTPASTKKPVDLATEQSKDKDIGIIKRFLTTTTTPIDGISEKWTPFLERIQLSNTGILTNIICDGVNPLIDEAKLLEEGVEDVPPISEEMEKELLGGGSPPQQGGPAALQPVPEPKTPKHHLPTLEESNPLAEFYGGLGDEELPANPIRRMIASLSLDAIQKGRNMTIATITEDQMYCEALVRGNTDTEYNPTYEQKYLARVEHKKTWCPKQV